MVLLKNWIFFIKIYAQGNINKFQVFWSSSSSGEEEVRKTTTKQIFDNTYYLF